MLDLNCESRLIMLVILLIIYSYTCAVYADDAGINDYNTKRANLISDEALLSVGGKIILTDKETVVNNCLMQYKYKEIDYSVRNPQYYNFSRHFFKYMDDIKTSKVYNIIRDMPKGAALHLHDMAILGPDYVMNITYMDNLYICTENDDIKFKFSNKLPKDVCSSEWILVSKARELSKNIKDFDAKIRKYFTMYVENPDVIYPSIKETWDVFVDYFSRILPLVTYRPVWQQYFYDVLKQFRSDHIMYLEIRSPLPNLYDLNGTVYNMMTTARNLRKTINRFLADYPDFFGAKIIFSASRFLNGPKLADYLDLALAIKKEMPKEFAGFDLDGREYEGPTLYEFAPHLLNASKDINYFFHAAETNWCGTFVDENLIDAILLGAKRLGHAYALPKHPLLMKEVIDKDIAIEVNLISNSVLSFVRDIRNHPFSTFLARGLPVVLSSDDPGIWEADSLSDDFYVAFVGAASRSSDLRLLKQLAVNSLKYSALNEIAKAEALTKFNVQWTKFIDNFNCSQY